MAHAGTAEFDVELGRAKVARELAGVKGDIEKGLGASAAKVESEFATAAKAAVKAFVVFRGGQFINDTVKVASDLNEQQQKNNVVFGQSVDIVNRFGKSSAEAFGISNREALTSTGTFGNLFRTLGLGTKVSAEMSTRLVGLAADLASFSNTSPEEALAALQSGLVGLTRPLRQYGINLDQAALKHKAMELGLSNGKSVLDASARAQAAYALILEQSKLAQGDFARTSGNLAQKQKILSAEWDNSKAKIGQDLIPAMNDLVGVGDHVLTFFDALPQPIQETALALGAAAVAGKVFGSGFGAAFKLPGRALDSLSAGLGRLGPATAATTAETDAFFASSATTSSALIAEATASDDLVVALQLVGATEEEIAVITAGMATAEAEATVATTSLTVALGAVGVVLLAAAAAYAAFHNTAHQSHFEGDASGILKETNAELLKTAAGIEALSNLQHGDPVKLFEDIGRKSLPALKAMRAAVKGAGQDTSDLDTAIAAVTAENERAARAEKKFGGALDETTGKVELAAKTLAFYQAVRKAGITTAIDASTREHDIQAAKLAERGTSEALTQAIKDEATARRAAAGDSDEYRAALAGIARDKEAEVKAAQDLSRAEIALSDAREQARRSLRDERLDNESAAIAAERAKLALEDAKDALAKIQDDPRATARQKEQALLDERDAEIALQQAQNHRGDSAADLAKAEQAGIEGAAGVVSAKQQVADAIKAQGDAEKQTATDTKAAAKIIEDAKANLVIAEGKTRDAVLAEADAQEKIAALAYGAAAGHDAYNASLLRSIQLLDPNSPFIKELDDYATRLQRLADLETLAITGHLPASQIGPAPGDIVPGQPLTSHGKPPEQNSGPHKTINLTIHQRNGATPAEVANELAFSG